MSDGLPSSGPLPFDPPPYGTSEPKLGREQQGITPPPLPAPLGVPTVDAHTHLQAIASRYRRVPDRAFVDAVMAQAASVGVTRVVNVGCEVDEWQPAIESTGHADVYAALALHPTAVGQASEARYAELEALLAHPKVVAVGETGLDYYWDTTTPADQAVHFRRHIDLAKRVGKPLMIHDRDAHADVLTILESEGAPPAGVVFHAFSGDAELARRCVDAGYVLSFPGVVTFGNAPALREAAAVTPLDQLLVETDAPFLTPHPYRGRPNAPYLIPLTARVVAEVKGVTDEVISAAAMATAQRIFGIA